MSTALMHLDDLRPVDLARLNASAALQTRVDRKYVLRPAELGAVLDRVAGDAAVLEIDSRRHFGYRSVYFDTPSFDSYLGAARKRPNRFKVRTRTYVDSGASWVEVKLRDRHGRTVKHRIEHAGADPRALSPACVAFVAGFPILGDLAHELDPVITTSYRRSTLTTGAARATIDTDVSATAGDGRLVVLDDRVIVETKSDRSPCPIDRALWDLGIRPTTISKFSIGAASLFPELPSNKWARVLRDHVRVVGA
jgi:hypothetical protein